MRTFIYTRVSREELNPENQVNEILASIKEDVPKHRIYQETISGSTEALSRPLFLELLNKMEAGDRLVVAKLDRLGRNNRDVLNTFALLEERGISVTSLDLRMPTDTAAGKLMLHILSAFADFERERIAERTREGILSAVANGKKLGTKKNAEDTFIKVQQVRHSMKHPDGSRFTQKDAANYLNLSLQTIKRCWNRDTFEKSQASYKYVPKHKTNNN